MAHPYTTTVSGMVAALRQLRSTFPNMITAETLKKWSIASNNESTVLVVLRFLKLIDEEGKKVAGNAKAFSEPDDAEFAKKFEVIVKAAYSELFESWGDGTWTLEKNKLIQFFRTTDDTSGRVGLQQYATFAALASLAGHGTVAGAGSDAAPRKPRAPRAQSEKKKEPAEVQATATKHTVTQERTNGIPAITLRVEINLPVSDDQSVYDAIFKSIRANLIDV